MRTDDRARFKHIGEEGDTLLLEREVSIAGLGGVGSKIAAILAREGINLRLVDMGRIEESDMHRLGVFYEEDITKFKVKQIKARLYAMNPAAQVKSFHEELTDNNVFLLKGNLVVDATNNPETNVLIHKYCSDKKLPLIIVRYCGSTMKVLTMTKKQPQKILERVDMPCIGKEGILGPSVSVAAGIAATQILKLLLDKKENSLIECDTWGEKLKVTKL